jgi:RNA polymerase sigma factor (sigma-70 family)
MVPVQLGPVLRHIHRLTHSSGLDGLSDGQLLERFAVGAEEAAFAALVRRHGPMVLGVCRRVLRHGPDAEDAFQATFLVLFRRAHALDRIRSVANWLYTVAYHVALRARADALRRQRHERDGLNVPREPSRSEHAGSDLQPALDEELNRLPDKYRAPVVLCYLEGKTTAEAGRLLGWPPGTVKGRLSRARALLRARLLRRGVTLAAGLVGTLLAGRASATVSGSLVTAAVQATATPSPRAALLAREALRTSLPGKVKLALALVMALGAVIGGAGVLGPDARARSVEEAPDLEAPIPEPDKGAAEEKPAFTVAGQVLGADGKPVPGARVAVIGLAERPYRGRVGYREHETLGAGETDKEGRFRLACVAESATRGPLREVIASAPGHGLGWSFLKRRGDNTDLEIKLSQEQVIRGRLIDLQGEPLKGVKLHVARVALPPGLAGIGGPPAMPGGISSFLGGGGIAPPTGMPARSWQDDAAPPAYGFPTPPARLAVWPAPLTTDAEGRFVVRGLGRDLTVTLLVTDERFARQELVVETTAKGRPDAFEQALNPAHLLEGQVVGDDTGRPVGKVLLEVHAGDRGPARRPAEVQVWTDERGRFRVNCPPGGRVAILPYPADGSPYLSRVATLEWPKGKVKHEVEVRLPRGVLVRGKVTEADSDKPVAGAVVSYFPREDNPLTTRVMSWRQFPGEFVRTKADGTFEATVYPGAGTLLAKGPTRDYVLQRVEKDLHTGQKAAAPVYAEAAAPLDLKDNTEPQAVSLKLRRGVTIRGRALDPDGKPVAEAVLYHPFHLRDNGDIAWFFHYSQEPVAVKDGRFELTGCDPKGKFPAYIFDPKAETGARVVLSGADAKDEVTVRLQPCGKAAMRYVDGDGKPVKGIVPSLQLVLDADADSEMSHRDFLGRPLRVPVASDAEGRVTVSGLIPGATYRYPDQIRIGGGFGGAGLPRPPAQPRLKEFTAEAGKTHELPDIIINRPPQ